jgi:hypothetical protein
MTGCPPWLCVSFAGRNQRVDTGIDTTRTVCSSENDAWKQADDLLDGEFWCGLPCTKCYVEEGALENQ